MPNSTPTQVPEDGLVERLLRTKPSDAPAHGSGSISAGGKFEMVMHTPPPVLANPDGPAAADRITADAAKIARLEALLQDIESANDTLCATRSQETYLRMIDVDGAMDALEQLDNARRAARQALSPSTSQGD